MTTTVEDRIELSEVAADERDYLRAYFAAALKGREFQSCKVTWLHAAEGWISFQVVFIDGSKSPVLQVPSEVAFVQDRNDEVVYDDLSGARRTILGFVQNGALKGLIDNAFFQKRVE